MVRGAENRREGEAEAEAEAEGRRGRRQSRCVPQSDGRRLTHARRQTQSPSHRKSYPPNLLAHAHATCTSAKYNPALLSLAIAGGPPSSNSLALAYLTVCISLCSICVHNGSRLPTGRVPRFPRDHARAAPTRLPRLPRSTQHTLRTAQSRDVDSALSHTTSPKLTVDS